MLTVIHVEYGGSHYYFGGIKAIYERFSEQEIGIGLRALYAYNLTAEKPFENKVCTIRKGEIQRKPQTGERRSGRKPWK